MSTCFEVYPTNDNIPEFSKIILKAVRMFEDFLKFHKIETYINTEIYAVHEDNIISEPQFITFQENIYNTIEINQTGNIYLFYIKHDDFYNGMWNDEIKNNSRAKILENSILKNRRIGYSWDIKRTVGQPAIVSLFYGFIAMALARETDGFIYSDDGAWSYELFPTEWQNLYSEYFNIDSIKNPDSKSTVKNWINLLKKEH
ncbi:MAG: hypothetical protein NC244_02690 [Alistipes senegalensis]|nr:hypothetical protein [Alistipes senegalensis]